MTVRDGARYLAQALESVRAQTFTSWELVLWDDGSTDESLAIARSFAAVEPRIRVFAEPAMGRRRALAAAHQQARGAYLGWLDCDDWLAPEALARTHAAITRLGCDMVYTDHVEVDAEGAVRGLGRRTRISYSAHRLLLDFMTFHFRLLSRTAFERAGGIDPDREIAIDYDLCLRLSELGPIEHVAEPLYFYRLHAEQMSSRRRSAQIAASADAIRAALARRQLTSLELIVDAARGRFRLVHRPPRVNALRLALASVVPRLRDEPVATPSAIGCWPTRARALPYPGPDLAAQRGAQMLALGDSLASLMRAVWTGRAGDELRVYSIAPLLAANDDGSVLGACWLFVKTLDHALARRMRVVWVAPSPLTTHPVHAARELWCRRALAARCHGVATRADVDTFRALGVPADRIAIAPDATATDDPKRRPLATVSVRRRVAGPTPLSVIIPIRNRAGADVRNALASLDWQRGGRPWETILVSHGSEPHIDAELRELARRADVTLVTVGSPDEPWCKPLALNTGILASDPAVEFVMTMDGDMILADNMLDTVVAELRANPRTIVLCQSSDLPQDLALPDEPAALLAAYERLRARATVRGAYGTGGIQAIRRSFLVEVRGYDEDMLWWGALDTDLVRRAETAGLRTSWITDRTAMLHQWHPRKHRILDEAGDALAARSAWQRNHALMAERAGHVLRNQRGWGATFRSDTDVSSK